MSPRQRLGSVSSRLIRGLLSLLLVAGFTATAGAQRDSALKAAPTDSLAVPVTLSLAQAEAAGVKLLGVFDANTGEWVAGATVRDTLGEEAQTSRMGLAALTALTPVAGYYMLEIRKVGYSPRWLRVRIDTTSEILTELAPNPLGGVALPTTVVTAERKLIADAGQREGFIYRCGTGLLSCVGRSELDKHTTGYLDDYLNHVDGIQRDCPAAATRPELAGRNAGAPPPTVNPGAAANGGCPIRMYSLVGDGHSALCAPKFFVNGFQWAELGANAQADLDQSLSAATIDGMEVYLPGRPVPKRFDAAPSSCGSVVIWTRGTKIPELKHLPPPVVGDTARKG